MPLYVIRPPNPPAGVDWRATVPGQYLYDITGITATLATQAGGATVAHDSSGNGRDGAYHGGNNTGWFFPGIVAGDAAFLTGTLLQGSKFWISAPTAVLQWTGSWSFAIWIQVPTLPASYDEVLVLAEMSPGVPGLKARIRNGTPGALEVFSDTGTWRTANGVIPLDGSSCFVALVWNGATLVPYIDGATVAWSVTPGTPTGGAVLGAPWAFSANGVVSNTRIFADEWTLWDTAISAGSVAAMHAAASVSFAAYTSAVLATGPAVYYHLDDGAQAAGRQVALAVTNGTDELLLIPSGFAIAAPGGPFNYSWQPALRSSSQNADGTQTTVAVPRLVLPAGYSVGARTLDLGAADQWSDVVVWWDSSLMDTENGLNDYRFPPGWKMDYHYDPAAP